ncbi:MAG: glutamate-5-semialdehyde dehydrogenase, partial [Bacilli bacterium]
VPNGLLISKRRVPIGVIGMIYESRPNVTCDASALCLKSGNSVMLRGGKEALRTNKAIVQILRKALKTSGLPMDCIQLIEDSDRKSALALMTCNEYVDVLIPRGGASLIKTVIEHATVPVIETGTGNCHLYIDADCDEEMAVRIALNGKVSRPSVCNALEKIIVHEEIAPKIIPKLLQAFKENDVEVRGDWNVRAYDETIKEANDGDWYEEYLKKTIAIKTVRQLDEAIHHINFYGSHHSDTIVTTIENHAEQFLNRIHSAVVYVNASTRFTDGEEFGFGAEIGISTQKLHARGPMGLKELTTTKYVVKGTGQIRS